MTLKANTKQRHSEHGYALTLIIKYQLPMLFIQHMLVYMTCELWPHYMSSVVHCTNTHTQSGLTYRKLKLMQIIDAN